MIQINELRITPDNKYFIIDVAIKDDAFFENISIDNIKVYSLVISGNTVDNIELKKYTFDSEGIKVYANDEEVFNADSNIYIDSSLKYTRLVLTAADLGGVSFTKDIFKVVINTSGNPSEDMPADYADRSLTALVVNLYPFYIEVLSNMRNLGCRCTNSRELVDSILRFKALELSMKTGNIDLAVHYWFKYFSNDGNIYGRKFITNNCNCHG